jgi:hypothetical protein
MNGESKIVHLPNRAIESHRKPEPTGMTESSMADRVNQAMEWLRGHAGSDYLDAATAIASIAQGELGRSGWPEFIAHVREAAGVDRKSGREADR